MCIACLEFNFNNLQYSKDKSIKARAQTLKEFVKSLELDIQAGKGCHDVESVLQECKKEQYLISQKI